MNTKEATLEVKVAPYVAELTPEALDSLIEAGENHLFQWLNENAPKHVNDLAKGIAILSHIRKEEYEPLNEFDEILISFINSLARLGWW